MRINSKLTHRFMSLLLCAAMLLSCLPVLGVQAAAASVSLTADPSTMNDWKEYFLPENGDLSTENAGGIWTDKSVFADATAFAGTGIEREAADSFLVALSAIGSNKTVTGMSNLPTDTMLVLDVSGSMKNNGSALVNAANQTIAALLGMNAYSRVGVVLYSGTRYSQTNADAAVLLLPLGRYTLSEGQAYLRFSDSSVSLNRAVVDATTGKAPVTANVSKQITGATYIQKGVIQAMEQFTATGNSSTVEIPGQGTVERMPILVLMSDGAPTLGTTDFTDPGQFQLGDGSNTSSALGFVNQLTAAYARHQIENKYGRKMLFYTLGLGIGGNTTAISVLDPSRTSSNIQEYWTRYNTTVAGQPVLVQQSQGEGSLSVTKLTQALSNQYVDRYFSSSQSSDLAAAFQDIVSQISLQSKYYPTLVSGDEDLSGYISFVDRIGQYMQVTDIKGLLINNELYSGVELAKNFVSGSADLGAEMLNAVMTRLGLETPEQAQALIDLAYAHGQISYVNENDYSNYIGWYANQQGQFLGFWHEGVETLPDPNDPSFDDATRPVFIVKSYGYLGAVDEDQGVEKSDMMYATVQVRENILTGEQYVVFAIPATLIPLVSYHVTLDEEGGLAELTASGAKEPIRLVYEVALEQDINAYNLLELEENYLQTNTDAGGNVSFYTNQYEADGSMGYNTVNAYSYFNPSRQNDRYYFLEDTTVYQDTNGTVYQGTAAPSGAMYRKHEIYQKVDGRLQVYVGYHALNADILETAVKSSEGLSWYIPRGSVRVDIADYTVYKGGLHTQNPDENKTGTLIYANLPFVDTHDHTLNDSGYNYIVGATLGNNGKLTLTPETGIKLSKELAEGVSAGGSFTFLLNNLSDGKDSSTYPARKLAVDGTASDMQVKFQNGEAAVTLAAGETLYIGGMSDGHQIRIREQESADYKVESVNAIAAEEITVTIAAHTLTPAAFVNTNRNKGNLVIAKEVEHDFGTGYEIPTDKSFAITVTLEGIGTANAEIPAKLTGSAIESIRTDENGSFTVSLKDDQQLELSGLPEGIIATVVEPAPGTGFEAVYWDNGLRGDGVVQIEGNATASVIVVNDYHSGEITGKSIAVGGGKLLKWYVDDVLTDYPWQSDYSFSFQLQKLDDNGLWQTIATDTVLGTDTEKVFRLDNAMDAEIYTAIGSYSYRIVESQENPLDGFRYDLSVHAFTVEVADADMDGKLEIKDVTTTGETVSIQSSADGWDVFASFTNIYAPDSSNQVSVEIAKLVENPTGSPAASAKGFRFALYDGQTQVAVSEYTDASGSTRLILGPYTEPASYNYILRELPADGAAPGWSYSTAGIPVTIEVVDNAQGELVAVIRQAEANANDTDTIIYTAFTNLYDPKDAELTIDFVSKQLSGRELKAGEFNFAVRAYGSETAILSGTNDAQGNVNFDGKLIFDKVGIYHYDVVEVSEDGKGITVDKNIYRVTVTVSDSGDGTLTAAYVLMNAEGDEILFKNSYTAAPVELLISGTKTLEGRLLLNDEFSFMLQKALDVNGTVDTSAEPVLTKNYADGSIRFPAIRYTEAGTYYYLVSEQGENTGKYGVQYDESVFLVTVQIIDDGEGQLIASDPVISKLNETEPVEEIHFVNIYTECPADLTVDLGVEKIVQNKGTESIGPEGFRFQLENRANGEKLTAESNEAGRAGFRLVYTDADAGKTFAYKLTEVNDGRENVKYSQAEYLIEIAVSLSEDNKLVASVSVDETPVDTVLCQFVNEYGDSVEPPPGPPDTSDSSMLFMWAAILFISGTGMVFLGTRLKKKEN